MQRQRYTVYYRGQVQGVGFRYSVCRLAGRFDVKGFVRNLTDGRVQVVAEGQSDELDRFLQAIDDEMADYMKSVSDTATLAFLRPLGSWIQFPFLGFLIQFSSSGNWKVAER